MALAVSLGNGPPHHNDPPEGPDSCLADHGFEYIDGERTRPPMRSTTTTDADPHRRATSGDYDEDEDADAIQGLPRVVDALSTIMWPSMVRERDSASGKRRSQAPTLFDFDVLSTEEDTLAGLMEADAADHGVPQTRASRMQKEMAALERWLIENEELHEADIRRTGGLDAIDDDDDSGEGEDHDDGEGEGDARVVPVPVPDIMHVPSDDPWLSSNHNNNNPTPSTAPRGGSATTTSGFDDDFAAFVSAPALPAASAVESSTAPTPAVAATTVTSASASAAFLEAPMLRPSHTGGSYRSLRSGGAASASDIDDHVGYEALDDDRSSFGFSAPEHDEYKLFDDHDDDDHDEDADQRMSTSTTTAGGGGRRVGGERRLGLGDDDGDGGSFDLTNILSALHSVREDVAGIEDEAQRRATTARFASEFVFKRMGVDGDEVRETEG